jgi:hypothetical protein
MAKLDTMIARLIVGVVLALAVAGCGGGSHQSRVTLANGSQRDSGEVGQ